MILDALPEVRQLPLEAKRQLLDELWAEVEEADFPRDERHVELCEQAWRQHLENPDAALSHAAARQRMANFKEAFRLAHGRR